MKWNELRWAKTERQKDEKTESQKDWLTDGLPDHLTIWPSDHLTEWTKQASDWSVSASNELRRQCQIRVRFESGVKKKFLAALNQLLTSFFHCHHLPWSHSFQKRYDMFIVKMNGLEDIRVLGQKTVLFSSIFLKFSWMTLAKLLFYHLIHLLVEEFIFLVIGIHIGNRLVGLYQLNVQKKMSFGTIFVKCCCQVKIGLYHYFGFISPFFLLRWSHFLFTRAQNIPVLTVYPFHFPLEYLAPYYSILGFSSLLLAKEF